MGDRVYFPQPGCANVVVPLQASLLPLSEDRIFVETLHAEVDKWRV